MSRKKKWSVKYTEHRHQNETTSMLRILARRIRRYTIHSFVVVVLRKTKQSIRLQYKSITKVMDVPSSKDAVFKCILHSSLRSYWDFPFLDFGKNIIIPLRDCLMSKKDVKGVIRRIWKLSRPRKKGKRTQVVHVDCSSFTLEAA